MAIMTAACAHSRCNPTRSGSPRCWRSPRQSPATRPSPSLPYATEGSNPRVAGPRRSKSAAHKCAPRLGQVGNQRDAMSTLAVSTLLDAMAAAPRLTKLKLGPVRDEVQRRRHQLLTMEAVERARRERAGSPELKRRANSPERSVAEILENLSSVLAWPSREILVAKCTGSATAAVGEAPGHRSS